MSFEAEVFKMADDRKCKSCKKPFQGRPNKLYCSVSCRRQAEIAKRAEKCRLRVGAWPDLSKFPAWDLPPFNRADWPGADEPLADASGWPPLTDWPEGK